MKKLVTFLWFNDQAKEAVDLSVSLFENARKYGLTWQIMPESLDIMMRDPDTAKADRVGAAMLSMGKLNLAELERAYRGEGSAGRSH